jgi:hypothetical protein
VDAFLRGPFAKDYVDSLLNAWSMQIQSAVVEAQGLNHAESEAQWADALMALEAKIDNARQHRGYAY